jgi:hypothetical protein
MAAAVDVEVFPVAADRWIAVVRAPDGEFSTEASSPGDVPDAVDRAVVEVLGAPASVNLQDDLGQPWSVASAPEQLVRLIG